MINPQKRERALRELNQRMDDYVFNMKRTVSGIRMNFWTAYWLFGDSANKHTTKPRGEADWPSGAFAYLADPYSTYMFIDNSLHDKVYEIEIEKD